MVDELFRCSHGILVIADQIYSFLIGTDIPQLLIVNALQLLVSDVNTYTIACQDDKFIKVRLYYCFRGVRVASDQILHVRVSQGPRNGKYPINTVIKNQTTGIGNTLALVFVAALVVVRQTKSFAVTTKHNPCI